MSLTFHWFLPTNGDGRDIVGGGHGVATGAAGAIRTPTVKYLGQIARSAEQLGFAGALTPTGAWCEDAWLTTAMLTEVTERLKFLVAFRPGQISPTLAAQMASTFQRQSRGRLLLNVVTGGESAEQRAYGDFLDKAQRYERTGEFLDIVTRLWHGETVTAKGRHLRVEGAKLSRLPDPVPDIYFGGSSGAGVAIAASHADVYLTWGEPPAQVDEKLRRVKAAADRVGRELRFGIRLHTISRDTAEQAWRQAGYLMERVTDDMIEKVQRGLSASESEGQQRMRALHGRGDRRNLEVYPNLWAGVGLVRGGAGTSLVGSHEEVANLIQEYANLGITEFILSGYPHLEEAYWFGEGVLPILERRGLWRHPAPRSAPGETLSPFAATHTGPGTAAKITAGT
ncbi:MAG: LLM class flavin-dependent oxidoreductase [Trebonia sp.]